jgi:hypothetical protein
MGRSALFQSARLTDYRRPAWRGANFVKRIESRADRLEPCNPIPK